jgi:hypothetical protein
MFETLAVFQLAMFWLKAFAEENICKQATRADRNTNRTAFCMQAIDTNVEEHCVPRAKPAA